MVRPRKNPEEPPRIKRAYVRKNKPSSSKGAKVANNVAVGVADAGVADKNIKVTCKRLGGTKFLSDVPMQHKLQMMKKGVVEEQPHKHHLSRAEQVLHRIEMEREMMIEISPRRRTISSVGSSRRNSIRSPSIEMLEERSSKSETSSDEQTSNVEVTKVIHQAVEEQIESVETGGRKEKKKKSSPTISKQRSPVSAFMQEMERVSKVEKIKEVEAEVEQIATSSSSGKRKTASPERSARARYSSNSSISLMEEIMNASGTSSEGEPEHQIEEEEGEGSGNENEEIEVMNVVEPERAARNPSPIRFIEILLNDQQGGDKFNIIRHEEVTNADDQTLVMLRDPIDQSMKNNIKRIIVELEDGQAPEEPPFGLLGIKVKVNKFLDGLETLLPKRND